MARDNDDSAKGSTGRDRYRDNDDVRQIDDPATRNDVRSDSRNEARGDARENVGNHARGTDASRDRPERQRPAARAAPICPTSTTTTSRATTRAAVSARG